MGFGALLGNFSGGSGSSYGSAGPATTGDTMTGAMDMGSGPVVNFGTGAGSSGQASAGNAGLGASLGQNGSLIAMGIAALVAVAWIAKK